MKTIVITGANKGIGLATALLFLENGWKVFGTYRQSIPSIDHENFFPIPLDLTSAENIRHAVALIRTYTPSIDALVNNSGILNDAQDGRPNIPRLQQTFAVNVFGTIDFTEELLPLVSEGGHILCIGSIMGASTYAIDGRYAYGYRMSKAALHMYVRTLAFRLKENGIIVSALHPGWVKTEMGESVATDDSHPSREPREAAEDIYRAIMTVTKAGCFWHNGKEREW